jgi:hypothetical protein
MRQTARNAAAQARTPTPDHDRTTDPRTASPAARGTRRHPDNRNLRPRVSWYGALLIALMLAIAAGWELWRLLLLALTLD